MSNPPTVDRALRAGTGRHSTMHLRRALGLLTSLAALGASLALAVPSTSSGAAPSGTVTFAEAPGANPNYIFPFMGCAYSSVNNVNQFQSLMFRPLYWFGLGGSTSEVPSLSPARQPVFTNANRTVTITLKGWRFANGEIVNARSVMFFLNLYRADPTSFCGYNSGYGIPDQVKSATGAGMTVRLTFTTPVNPNWILYNYLSEITPMPVAWDRTSATQTSTCSTGAYGAASTNLACTSVEAYLNTQSLDPTTYTGRLWQSGVDGPWRLTSFNSSGNATFQPNPRYSGPQKAQVRFVKLVAYSSTLAEENDLKAGKLSIGYLDPSVLAKPAPAPGKKGPNWGPIDARYSMMTATTWGFNFAAINFSAADPKSAALNQLYVRQALQLAVDQNGIILTADMGYGTPIYSPLPPNTHKSVSAAVANPYPYNLSAALALLAAHGWTLQNNLQTCTNPGTGPGQCGAGIAAGYPLSFNAVWASGSPSLDLTMNADIANWQSVGISVNKATASFNNVVSDCSGGSGFEICAWGTGWTYSPNYFPSGEALFAPGGGFNVGSYSDPKMTSLIDATTFGSANLTAYANYAARQLPVIFQPQPTVLSEVEKTLKGALGFTPNPLGNFTPEYLHY
jgi:peptide/nickel transport system substrate-binding protein